MAGFLKLVMADDADLIRRVAIHLEHEYRLPSESSPLLVMRALVSSPRLADYFVRDLEALDLDLVADSFLSEHAMLCDWNQKSVGVGLTQWSQISKNCETVQDFDRGDSSVFRVKIWPFAPRLLSLEAKKIAVAVSFTELELIREPRIFGAINDLLQNYNIEANPEI